MTRILLLIVIGVISCNSNDSKTESTEVNDLDMVEQAVSETNTSYETLKTLLINNQPIFGEYLLSESKEPIGSSLNGHSILQESNEYVLVQSTNARTDILNYYLVSFSKTTGILIDYLPIGTETEGVDPDKITWKSNTAFSTVSYQYELLEDEESGAYIKGALLDSIVQSYDIAPNGIIISQDAQD